MTIGLEAVPAGHADQTSLTPGFPAFGPDRLVIADGSWYVAPDDLQGHPGEFDNPPDQVLIGQFSVAAGAGPMSTIVGNLLIQGEEGDGTAFQDYLEFPHGDPPAPGTLGVLGIAGLLGARRRRGLVSARRAGTAR